MVRWTWASVLVVVSPMALVGACSSYGQTPFVHSVGQCDSYVEPSQQSECHECVRRPPHPGGTWVYWPNKDDGQRCHPGNPQPY
ncbi:MAG: hypothetical protein U0414_36675 [Polyangiaceae bacterium]